MADSNLIPDHMPSATWITSDESLAQICQQWQQQSFLAVDTEFVRTRTFYPIAGLLQIADTSGCYLIDPLAISNWKPFADVLSGSVVKVFHACLEDIEVCHRLTGCRPNNLVDSQTAIALLGHGSSMGFQKAVLTFLNIELDKGETRSNWVQRPLTEQQIHYAVADVWYLWHLFPLLKSQLEQQDRWSWLEEEGKQAVHQSGLSEDGHQEYYRRIKLAWKLRPQEQYILQQVACWRERLARSLDLPRNKVIDDTSLWNVARYKSYRNDLLAKSGVKAHIIRQYGVELAKVVEDALSAPREVWPKQLDKPLSITATSALKQLKQVVKQKAEELGIPAEILLNKKKLTEVVRRFEQGNDHYEDIVSGWRSSLIVGVLKQASTSLGASAEISSEVIDNGGGQINRP